MKKFIYIGVVLTLICLFTYIFWSKETRNYQLIINNLNISPSPTTYSSPTVSWNDITYAYEYFVINDITQLTLIANFTQKKTSELLIKENSCQYVINGGYYDTNNKPLGLFINSMLKTPSVESAFVNGYVSITNKPAISFDLPKNPIIAVQTGPMLIVDGKKLKLAINNDEHARRMIAGISQKGTLVFMTIFVPETKVQGPKLADLPEIIENINSILPDLFITAINLDGGNASMFKNTDIYIQEVSSVGSLFCLH